MADSQGGDSRSRPGGRGGKRTASKARKSPPAAELPPAASGPTETLGDRQAPQQAGSCASLAELAALIPTCGACPRLRRYCVDVAANKVKRYADWDYHGRPVPGFGDPGARLLIVGLAPAAHGANRTGRLFTGDRSGDFLFAGLHRAGLASQAESAGRSDGLVLHGVYISVAGRCAPPANRPSPAELDRCLAFLRRELQLLSEVRVVIALGGLAHAAVGAALAVERRPFAHAAEHPLPEGRVLLDCYHVSQQNTFTGRLTPAMLDAVLARAARLAGLSRASG